jgi:hypothetical protein
MKQIIVVSLFLNLASIYTFFRREALTEEYMLLLHAPITILMVIYLFYLIAKGEAN